MVAPASPSPVAPKAPIAPVPPAKEAKAPKVPKEPKAPKEPRKSNLAVQYPNDAKITVVAKENPKRAGTKAHARFELYTGVSTVGAYLAKEFEFEGEKLKGTYTDLAYNVGRGFIKVG